MIEQYLMARVLISTIFILIYVFNCVSKPFKTLPSEDTRPESISESDIKLSPVQDRSLLADDVFR